MLSKQGNEVLSKLYQLFHDRFVENRPGCNENDCERAFLSNVLYILDDRSIVENADEISEMIYKIE